jgi:hypothetical protein
MLTEYGRRRVSLAVPLVSDEDDHFGGRSVFPKEERRMLSPPQGFVGFQ